MKRSAVATVYGSVPLRSACPANNNGYGEHETDALSTLMSTQGLTPTAWVEVYPCKRCGGLFAIGFSEL